MKKLNPKAGPIIFLGGMNAMPMMYAIELKTRGFDVIYIVDRPASDSLSRPENHFAEIKYPYPSWIVECNFPTQLIASMFPRLTIEYLRRKIAEFDKAQAFFLNGFFISLSCLLSKKSIIICLSHGSDLDTWADIDNVELLIKSFKGRSFFKYFPSFLSSYFIKDIVRRQLESLERANCVIYFPKGFNKQGDRVIERITSKGVFYLPRYDVSFNPLISASREFKKTDEFINIFCGVRFLYRTFPDGNTGYNKGNDIIIRGMHKFAAVNPNFIAHFVEKGEDVKYAKELLKELDIEKQVVWHKEMPFKSLINLYEQADICFDQCGEHWIGAIGAYALWLGKPLIANCNKQIELGLWKSDNPIFCAASDEEVFKHLVNLQSESVRLKAYNEGKVFAENFFSASLVLDSLLDGELDAR